MEGEGAVGRVASSSSSDANANVSKFWDRKFRVFRFSSFNSSFILWFTSLGFLDTELSDFQCDLLIWVFTHKESVIEGKGLGKFLMFAIQAVKMGYERREWLFLIGMLMLLSFMKIWVLRFCRNIGDFADSMEFYVKVSNCWFLLF